MTSQTILKSHALMTSRVLSARPKKTPLREQNLISLLSTARLDLEAHGIVIDRILTCSVKIPTACTSTAIFQ